MKSKIFVESRLEFCQGVIDIVNRTATVTTTNIGSLGIRIDTPCEQVTVWFSGEKNPTNSPLRLLTKHRVLRKHFHHTATRTSSCLQPKKTTTGRRKKKKKWHSVESPVQLLRLCNCYSMKSNFNNKKSFSLPPLQVSGRNLLMSVLELFLYNSTFKP